MAANAVANHVFWLALGRERVFHNLVDPFYRVSDEQFRKRFCLRKETAQELLICYYQSCTERPKGPMQFWKIYNCVLLSGFS